ncbi:T9SS type A sorting domain-containing protein [Chryseobacterium sp. 2TAF14]|uniref:T9SS type A sorting domain-containing protein n=1 Tax=Chryseobacterium sp. 2TAF14 TaxID=3233007 RepID=UPI003F922A87
MKKNLLTIGVLAIGLSVQAQVLLHVDNTAKMYVSNGTLVYNGGGVQTKGTGNIDLHGNMMVVGSGSDVLRTINTDSSVRTDGANIILRINDTASPVTSSYGQLYIKGVSQGNISGVVDKEYAATRHGAYQQIGIPFIGKTFSSLSTDLAGNFNNSRWMGREILKWSNADRRFDGSIIPSAPITSGSTAGITIDVNSAVTTAADKTAYYTLGAATMNPVTLHTVKGTPYADGISGAGNTISLIPSSVPATFGAGGNNRNIYQEKYNTYIYDPFDNAIPWNTTTTTFGQFFYQFSNPYLTNIDLSMIGFTEAGVANDNNAFTNIWGIVVDPQNVTYNTTTGGTTSYAGSQMVTFDPNTHKPIGSLTAALVVRPLGTFKIKLRNSTPQEMDFDNLRRFNYTPRAEGTSYSVTAAKNTTTGAIKQLGVLALDANGNQIGETYYVVAPQFTTGNIPNASVSSVQAMTNTSAIIQTFEEAANGTIDQNYSSTYRLYINEANEVDYLGKKINLSVFGQNISSLKFEIRDNVDLVPNATHILSGGTGFYYTVANGQAVQIKQGDVIPVTNSSYGLYYGAPQNNGTLNTNEVKPESRTLVVYNPSIKNYIVRFDPAWKSASVEVFDASGKLVVSEKSVKTDGDYVIKLDSSIKAAYIVKVVGNDGNTVNTKILIK